MNRRPLSCNWTGEDQRTYAKWRCGTAVFYGCMALLIFGMIALTKSSNVASNNQQIWSDGQHGDRMNRNADVSGNTR
jgi:predicted small integral membrane protein